jgi:hypothetical protein
MSCSIRQHPQKKESGSVFTHDAGLVVITLTAEKSLFAAQFSVGLDVGSRLCVYWGGSGEVCDSDERCHRLRRPSNQCSSRKDGKVSVTICTSCNAVPSSL